MTDLVILVVGILIGFCFIAIFNWATDYLDRRSRRQEKIDDVVQEAELPIGGLGWLRREVGDLIVSEKRMVERVDRLEQRIRDLEYPDQSHITRTYIPPTDTGTVFTQEAPCNPDIKDLLFNTDHGESNSRVNDKKKKRKRKDSGV